MSSIKALYTLCLKITLSIIFGLATLLFISINLLIKGPKTFLYVKKHERRPEILDDPQFGTHCYARLKKARIHYVDSGPHDKPLMLFLHGFPEFWYSWRKQITEFSKDYRVVAMDLRGFGESEKPDGVSSYRLDKLVGDVHDLIVYLGYEKCYVIGHDWGGGVAWGLARRHPQMVEKMVQCNMAPAECVIGQAMETFSQMIKSWYVFAFQWPLLPALFIRSEDLRMIQRRFSVLMKPGSASAEDIDAYKYTLQDYKSVDCPINYYRAFVRCPPVDPRFYRRATAPTLVIWGTNDHALGRNLAELSRDYAVDCTVRYIEGASHWVQQEEPELVNKYIREFIADAKQ